MKRNALLTTVLIAPALLVLGGCDRQSGEPAASEPSPQSTEWTVEDPAKPAVPVDLPDTPMRNVPAQGASGSPSPTASPAAR
jgi:hypothetical protein